MVGKPTLGAPYFYDSSYLRRYSDESNAFQFVPYPCNTLRFLSNTGSPPTHTPIYKVSPNPFQETAHISADFYPVATTFTLFNHAGSAVIQAIPLNEMTNIHTEHLPGGIYYWKIQNNEGLLQSGTMIKM